MLPGTEGAYSPFWSPDNHQIAFFTNDKLQKKDVTGGSPQTLCVVKSPAGGGDRNRDGVVLFSGTEGSGIFRVSAAGGESTQVLQSDKSRQQMAQWLPQFLPDGRHFLYLSGSVRSGKGGICLGSLDSKEERMLLPIVSTASYAPPGFLIYGRQTTLLAQPFDAAKLRLTGRAFPIAERVGLQRDFRYPRFPSPKMAFWFMAAAAITRFNWPGTRATVRGRP